MAMTALTHDLKGYIHILFDIIGPWANQSRDETLGVSLVVDTENIAQELLGKIQEITDQSINFIVKTKNIQEKIISSPGQKAQIKNKGIQFLTKEAGMLLESFIPIQIILEKGKITCVWTKDLGKNAQHIQTRIQSIKFLNLVIKQKAPFSSRKLQKEVKKQSTSKLREIRKFLTNHIESISLATIALLVLIASLYFPAIRSMPVRIYGAINKRIA